MASTKERAVGKTSAAKTSAQAAQAAQAEPVEKAAARKPASKKSVAKKPASRKPAAKKAASGKSSGKTAAKSSAVREGKTLVIVESPAKAKTIEKYLGTRYQVLASMGHLIDLPKSRLGVDAEHGFEPEYLTIRGRASILKDLQKAAKKSKAILMASDPDREGEAIAFQIGKYLHEKEPGLPIDRIAFNEITPDAIRSAVKEPRAMDMTKVAAQKARRVLDRLVGYNLSPLLWKKVKSGLSAGRVQSVALRLICDREKEVESFLPEEYWTVEGDFKAGKVAFSAELVSLGGEKPALRDGLAAEAAVRSLEGRDAAIRDIRETEKVVKPKPPFTTSKLQQTAANRLGFTSKKTMQLAQQLYEGVNLGSTRMGLITYMRTDSVRISETAITEVREWIGVNHPAQLPSEAIRYGADAKSQDAHEAIRPTKIAYIPDQLKDHLNRDQLRLYTLIWERFVASQMTNARMKVVTADIAVGDGLFRSSGSVFVDEGFFKVIRLGASREERANHALSLKIGQEITVESIRSEQHFTQGPSRFTDASIIKMLEEQGIGRPSTYAPTISVLLERFYVTRESRQLVPTALGRIIADILVESFPDVVDAGFTARMESMLDAVEEGRTDWVAAIAEFYGPFKKRVDEVMETLSSVRGRLDEETNVVCEKCGRPMVKKLGRFGFFLACTGFPECKNTKSVPLAVCPKCGGDIVGKRAIKGKGREFYGCSNYPACDFRTYDKPTGSNCPECGWFLVEKSDRKTGGHKACINPACGYLHTKDAESGEEEGSGQED